MPPFITRLFTLGRGLLPIYALSLIALLSGAPAALANETTQAGALTLWWILAGIILLLTLLLLMAGLFAKLNLSEHQHAFGLPPGTIRAVLAISLIVVFVAFSIYLLGQDYDTGDKQNPVNQAKLEFAKQIFTAIATALAVVLGFYFGSRGSATATSEAAKALLVGGEPDKKLGALGSAVETAEDRLKQAEAHADHAEKAKAAAAEKAQAEKDPQHKSILEVDAAKAAKASAAANAALKAAAAAATRVREAHKSALEHKKDADKITAASIRAQEALRAMRASLQTAQAAADRAEKALKRASMPKG